MSSKLTKAPGHMTESEVLKTMEKNGIGTDASMPTHIKNIVDRGYVTVNELRQMVPTKLGVALIRGIDRIDRELVTPQVRASIENQCYQIAKGTAEMETVVDKAINLFKMKYVRFSENFVQVDLVFQATFLKKEELGFRELGKCGNCNLPLQHISRVP